MLEISVAYNSPNASELSNEACHVAHNFAPTEVHAMIYREVKKIIFRLCFCISKIDDSKEI